MEEVRSPRKNTRSKPTDQPTLSGMRPWTSHCLCILVFCYYCCLFVFIRLGICAPQFSIFLSNLNLSLLHLLGTGVLHLPISMTRDSKQRKYKSWTLALIKAKWQCKRKQPGVGTAASTKQQASARAVGCYSGPHTGGLKFLEEKIKSTFLYSLMIILSGWWIPFKMFYVLNKIQPCILYTTLRLVVYNFWYRGYYMTKVYSS